MEKRDNSDRIQIRFGVLPEKINMAQGKMPLSTWVKSACEESLTKLPRDENVR
jgi:hypothetical protein